MTRVITGRGSNLPGEEGTVLSDDLKEELEVACMDAIRGDPPGPAVAGRLERTVRAVLMRHGVDARVSASSDRRGTAVTILVKRPGATVQQVTLTIA